jgi:hypothetical protein
LLPTGGSAYGIPKNLLITLLSKVTATPLTDPDFVLIVTQLIKLKFCAKVSAIKLNKKNLFSMF